MRLLFLIACISWCTSCRAQNNNEVMTSRGLLLNSQKLNATYFFPFEQGSDSQDKLKEINFGKGFIISWNKAEWKYSILDNFSTPLEDKIFDRMSFAEAQYIEQSNMTDSYNVLFVNGGDSLILEYDDREVLLNNIKGYK